MYEQCEATIHIGYLPADRAIEKCGSMGIAIPGGHFRLEDENGQKIQQSYVTGELIYTGKNVTLGYLERVDELKRAERNGILLTGDMVQFSEEGYYHIVGWKKLFLKIYGNCINLDIIGLFIKGEFETEEVNARLDGHIYLYNGCFTG